MIDHKYIDKHGDPRISKYPFMDNPLPTVVFTSVFFVFVKYLGPRFMQNRDPYVLRLPMIVYNISLVILAAWTFLKFGIHGWFTKFNWSCEPIDYSNDRDALELVTASWLFFISKFIEFTDTIFFVLRKKDSQLSKLHIFHHCIAPITSWYAVKYGPGGYNTFFMMANSFVHIWMYLYYGLAALGPAVQKYLWWKKYLTSLQLVQFILVIGYFSRLHFSPPMECKVSPFLVWLSLSEALVFLILFTQFYLSTYRKNAAKGIEKYKRK